MILLWGLPGDGPFDAVAAALRRCGASFAMIDQRLIRQTTVDLSIGSDLAGMVRVGDQQFNLSDAHAAYWRTYDVTRLPELAAGTAAPEVLQAALRVEDALTAWLETTPALVINRPSAMASNNSKPYQLNILRAHGFDVPATLITTDPDTVLRFWTDRAAVIYKSISGVRSVVTRLSETHVSRLDSVISCPTQFQQYIPGTDYRVHMVGDEVFASEVHSTADDYRYPDASADSAEVRAAHLPAEIASRCIAVTRKLGLAFAGIDLRRTPDGRWFCFEANPSPGFTYYESHTRQPIADAVARLLGSVRKIV